MIAFREKLFSSLKNSRNVSAGIPSSSGLAFAFVEWLNTGPKMVKEYDPTLNSVAFVSQFELGLRVDIGPSPLTHALLSQLSLLAITCIAQGYCSCSTKIPCGYQDPNGAELHCASVVYASPY